MKSSRHPINTIFFDLDGTLIDTEASAAQAIRLCFADWGITVSETDSSYVTGRTWAAAFSYLFSKYPLPLPPEQATEAMMRKYRETLETELVVVPGAVSAVRSLSEASYPLALISGSGRQEILWALRKLGILEHFRVVLGAEDYPRSKPEPDGYLKALNLLGASPERVLVFEDSQAGIASARAAGLWVVAITGTNHFAQDTSHAHRHIPDLSVINEKWVAEFHSKSV